MNLLHFKPRTYARPRNSGSRGFTLVEIVVSMVILGLLAIGIVSATLQVRRSAEATVRESSANAVAMGFLEQVQGMDYTALHALSEMNGTMVFIIRDGDPLNIPLNTGAYVGPLAIPINVDEEGLDVASMAFWIRCDVLSSADGLPSLDIRLRFRWEDPYSRQLRDGEYTLVRARSQN